MVKIKLNFVNYNGYQPDALELENVEFSQLNPGASSDINGKPLIIDNSNSFPLFGSYGGNRCSISIINGGGKKPTKKRVVVKGKPKVVYKGPRGGEYIKQNGGFVSLKTL